MFATADQCFRYVHQHVDKANAGTMNRVEFNVLYNGAQTSMVRSAYESAEKSQKYVDLLRQLTPAPLVVANTGTQVSEGERFLLPYVANPPAGTTQGYMHMLSVGLEIASLVNNQVVIAPCTHPSGFSPARIMPRDSRYVHDRDPFKRPTTTSPYIYYVENYFTARCGTGRFANRARIEYLRHPIDIDAQSGSTVDPETPASFNQSVCDLVVRIYLEKIESRRVQTMDKDNPLHT